MAVLYQVGMVAIWVSWSTEGYLVDDLAVQLRR